MNRFRFIGDLSLWSLDDLDGKTYVSTTGQLLLFKRLTELLKRILLPLSFK